MNVDNKLVIVTDTMFGYCGDDAFDVYEFNHHLARAYALGIRDIMMRLGVWDGHCKSYDPLLIKGDVAHSYVFDLEDGGRHHPFDGDYEKLCRTMVNEACDQITDEYGQ